MSNRNEVLFEIGVEELPARFIDLAEKALYEKTTKWLTEQRIAYQEAKTFSTPRRLAIYLTGVADQQETVVETVRGPRLDIAKDESGNWTNAAIGFTKGQGKTVEDITIEEIKGVSYTFVEKRIEGQETIEVLSDFVHIIESIPFQQTMRWGENTFRFARPIRWLVAMMNEKVIPLQLTNVVASNETYGHRFLGSKVQLSHPREYEEKLEENYVIADPKRRESLIVEQIQSIEKEENFYIDVHESLLNEVRNLVEYPTAFYGNFDEAYLTLPEEVLITSMREHQRYFPVFENEEKEQLLAHFVSVRNGDLQGIENVIRGNEKVLSARLADGRFFYDEDRAHSIDSYLEKLKTVIFQEQLGTIYDKTNRVVHLAEKISEQLALDADTKSLIKRAASISKFDLVTSMVNEFPELQGIIGEKYAAYFGEAEEVAQAVKDHYKPSHAKDDLPTSVVSSVVSVADKLDTIVGTISVGLIPTGSQDPYGLRRQAIGILRILLENKWNLDLESLVQLTEPLFETKETDKVIQFLKDRAVYIFSHEGVEQDVIQSVIHDDLGVLHYKLDKAKLLSEKRQDASFKPVQEAFVRLINLDKEDQALAVDPASLQTPSEQALYAQYIEVKEAFNQHHENLEAKQALAALSSLAEAINEFFEHNMVMDPDESLKRNRLALVSAIAALIKRFADVTMIEWRQHH